MLGTSAMPFGSEGHMKLTINGQAFGYTGDPAQPLLWFLRDEAGLTGTKFGCGIGQCGSCTVHVDGRARRACMLPMGRLDGRSVVTIEGLSEHGDHPLQRAWRIMAVPQCGYCQAGQIMAAADWLTRVPAPTDDDIDRLQTNICRCGTYVRIRTAIKMAAGEMAAGDGER
jgi:isoquinoline 1-oxidoreductase alpha subunit